MFYLLLFRFIFFMDDYDYRPRVVLHHPSAINTYRQTGCPNNQPECSQPIKRAN